MNRVLPLLLLMAVALPARADFALWLARVSANEGALRDRREMDLVWQVVEDNGGRDRPAFLRRHSPRVHGDRKCSAKRNCQWSPLLNREGSKPDTLDVPDDYWELVLRPTWLDLVAYGDYLVAGGAYNRPCARSPRTWGGPMDVERAARRRPPLYPMGCNTAFNDGFAPFWAAQIADGSQAISYDPGMEVAWLKSQW